MKLRKIGEQNNIKDIDYSEVNGYLFSNLKGPEEVKVNSYFARMKVKYLIEQTALRTVIFVDG